MEMEIDEKKPRCEMHKFKHVIRNKSAQID